MLLSNVSVLPGPIITSESVKSANSPCCRHWAVMQSPLKFYFLPSYLHRAQCEVSSPLSPISSIQHWPSSSALRLWPNKKSLGWMWGVWWDGITELLTRWMAKNSSSRWVFYKFTDFYSGIINVQMFWFSVARWALIAKCWALNHLSKSEDSC